MSDRFDEMATEWFAKLPQLASEQYGRRYLARFLREAVESAVAADRKRMVAIVQKALVGETCDHSVDGELCGQPAIGACRWRPEGSSKASMLALCEACAALPGVTAGGSWLCIDDLSRL